ncbi:hypothetical protein TNCT_696341 [Trichonephila clavata]|uniref:Uncharacterized protein n=1 Tax=Trichonephila clavata TaxID=2740835 RepID=A0A8X6FCL4_TRICU|nr:hypothetical protein TNCT_696341 [Trichonephila clavata]
MADGNVESKMLALKGIQRNSELRDNDPHTNPVIHSSTRDVPSKTCHAHDLSFLGDFGRCPRQSKRVKEEIPEKCMPV